VAVASPPPFRVRTVARRNLTIDTRAPILGYGLRVSDVVKRLLRAWRGEIEARYVYEVIAGREPDPDRARIIRGIADTEATHRERLERRLRELGEPIPDPSSVRISAWLKLQARLAPIDRLLQAREAAEDDEVDDLYGKPTGDEETDRVLAAIRSDERSHAHTVDQLSAHRGAPSPDPNSPEVRLRRILGRENWHRSGQSWVSDAIYGANDGLAAVFGMVTGVSGATAGSNLVLTAGLAGATASALSMGVGAWLAARSEREMAAANREQERREIESHPAEEKEELSLFYQLKGLSQEEADHLAERLSADPEVFLEQLAAEENLGAADAGGDPATAALAGFLSTGVGAMVPVLPFFFVHGYTALIWAGAVSLIAHFLVGAAKSLVTLRTWWGAGLEMTAAGVLVGGATYGLGLIFRVVT
jgi:vacuolar iron transporter family protein